MDYLAALPMTYSTESSGRTIGEQWSWSDVERSDRGLIYGNISKFSMRSSGKLQETSVELNVLWFYKAVVLTVGMRFSGL